MHEFFSPEEQGALKAFIGTDHQQFLVRNYRRRLAEFMLRFLECSNDELIDVRANFKAYHNLLREISLDSGDLSHLDTETVDEMEAQRRFISEKLEKHQRESRERASYGAL